MEIGRQTKAVGCISLPSLSIQSGNPSVIQIIYSIVFLVPFRLPSRMDLGLEPDIELDTGVCFGFFRDVFLPRDAL